MRRLTAIFILLLGLATLTMGELWSQVRLVLAGHGSLLNGPLAVTSGILLAISLIGLSRIVARTVEGKERVAVRDHQENSNE